MRSTFPSQKCQKRTVPDHLWKFRCRKSARRRGAKHMSKSKCTKHLTFGPLLEVAMPKKCTPLWREVHFQVKMYKAPHVRTAFGSCDAEKVHAVGAKYISKSKCTKHLTFGPLLEVAMPKKCTPLARSTFPSQNVQSTSRSDRFWKLRCRKSARRCGAKQIPSQKCQKLMGWDHFLTFRCRKSAH